MFAIVIGHILAVAIGISLGLIGGGGSILAVPILRYVMGLDPKVAIAMSLGIVGTVSLIGVIPHWRQGNVNLKTAIIFTPPAMLGSYLGARLTDLPFITETFQLICFGIVMLIAGIFMIRKDNKNTIVKDLYFPNKYEKQKHKYSWLAIPAEGLGVGILTGFVGVGGGFLIIPALVLLGGIPMKQAIGTSLAIIVFKSATGFLGYFDRVNLDWNLMISFTIAASLGTIYGAYLTRFVNSKQLGKLFGYFVFAVAIFVLIQR